MLLTNKVAHLQKQAKNPLFAKHCIMMHKFSPSIIKQLAQHTTHLFAAQKKKGANIPFANGLSAPSM